MAHAEEHLALAGRLMVDGHRPWLATWHVTGEKFPTWQMIAGNNRSEAEQGAIYLIKGRGGKQDALQDTLNTLRVFSLLDPSCPLQGDLRGTSGTTNHRREGFSVGALFAWLYEPNLWPEFRDRLIKSLDYQINVAMWAVPSSTKHGGGPVSEFIGPSHPQWHSAADAIARVAALKSKDSTLLNLTSELWTLIAIFLLSVSSDGIAYLCGPRATRKIGKRGKEDLKRRGDNACMNALTCEFWAPNKSWPISKLNGADMVSAYIVKKFGVRAMTDKPVESNLPATTHNLPRTVDPMIIARSSLSPNADVACWIDLPDSAWGHNNTSPGYQYSAMRLSGSEYFIVKAENSQPDLGFHALGHSSHPRNRSWPIVWKTRSVNPGGNVVPVAIEDEEDDDKEEGDIMGDTKEPNPPPPSESPNPLDSISQIISDMRSLADKRPAAAIAIRKLADRLERLEKLGP